MTNTITWLLVADASKAKIYSLHKAKVFQDNPNGNLLTLVEEFQHNNSRKKNSELVSDRMGDFGPGKLLEVTPPKTIEAEQFALKLTSRLDNGRKEDSYQDLVIVAPPNFMGLLNKHMHNQVTKLLSKTIEKDYTQQAEKELVKSLVNLL